MVGTRDSDQCQRHDAGEWVRPVVIVLFFILVGLVSTSPASVTEPTATSLGRQEVAGPC